MLAGIHKHTILAVVNDRNTYTCILVMFHGFLRKATATWNKPRNSPTRAEQIESTKYAITRDDLKRKTAGSARETEKHKYHPIRTDNSN